jgi:hypothetical protein
VPITNTSQNLIENVKLLLQEQIDDGLAEAKFIEMSFDNPISSLFDPSLEDNSNKIWKTLPQQINLTSLYKFAYELTLKDAKCRYFFVPDMSFKEQFV